MPKRPSFSIGLYVDYFVVISILVATTNRRVRTPLQAIALIGVIHILRTFRCLLYTYVLVSISTPLDGRVCMTVCNHQDILI